MRLPRCSEARCRIPSLYTVLGRAVFLSFPILIRAAFALAGCALRTVASDATMTRTRALLRRVRGFLLFILDDLQAFDLLEGEAHDAAVLALVLEVDGLLVVVDENLRRNPAAVVEPLCPLRDVFVLYLLGLLAHLRFLLFPTVFLYPEEALCIPQKGSKPLFTVVRGIRILRTSSFRNSR